MNTSSKSSQNNQNEIDGSSKDRFWLEPQKLPECTKSLPMPFDLEMLPKAFQDWVEDVSYRQSVPCDYAAVSILIAFSTIAICKFEIQPKALDESWKITPVLWGALCANPSNGKTPVMREALRFLYSLEEKHAENNQPMSGQPDYFVTNDSTYEALVRDISFMDHGVLVFRDELKAWFRTLLKEGRESDRGFFLEGWSGQSQFHTSRITRGHNSVKRLAINVFGSIQPDPLRQLIRKNLSGDDHDGLIARFQLLVKPASPNYEYVDRPINEVARQSVEEAFLRIFNAGMHAAESNVFRFSEAAQTLFTDWYSKHQQEFRKYEEKPLYIDHLGKQPDTVAALALLNHLADGEEGNISVDAIERALRWIPYLESHLRTIYDVKDEVLIAARKLSEKILDGQITSRMTPRLIYNKGWSGLHSTVEKIGDGLKVLEEYHWIRLEVSGKSTIIHINPDLNLYRDDSAEAA